MHKRLEKQFVWVLCACLIIITTVWLSVNSPLSSSCSEGTDSYSLYEIEETPELNISDDVQGENETESPFEAEYVLW